MPTALEAPPHPPDLVDRHGWGGGRRRPPWDLWLALLSLLAMAAYTSWLSIRVFKWQPIATVVALAWATSSISILHRRFFVLPEAREIRIALWCILGGFVAQTAQIVVDGRFSIGPMWIAVGILGIGGGFGVGSMAVVRSWFLIIVLARLLRRWRAA